MGNYTKGLCVGTETFKGCGKEGFLVNVTRKLCAECNGRRLNVGKKIITSIKKKPRKPTGELEVFKEIWEERPHVSEVSGLTIYRFDIRCFSHILTKGAYGRFRLKKDNILLVTPEEHNQWEFGDRSQPKWEWVKGRAEALKEEYYRK
jgi:hypothetical protein